MSAFLQNTFILLTTLSALLLPIAPAAHADPFPEDNAGEAAGEHERIYGEGEQKLPEDLYLLYRIVDRIARANNLDNEPWRVAIDNERVLNAYASEANLLTIYFGYLDQFAGNVSALACVVAHEMAHHTEQHVSRSDVFISEWAEKYGLGSSKFHRRAEELWRTYEAEADIIGYEYAVTAGFDPEGCIRTTEVIARLPGGLQETTHPSATQRRDAYEVLMAEQPAEQLRALGQANLADSLPLTYDMLWDYNWLRINPAQGGDNVDDWNRLFPDTPIQPTVETSE
ncbi:MAG: M48 family metalloprotease [Spirulina sp. SIO3F2]|nr:M48 family metalloprotease [Spirulina sp. SIO3F2]